MRTHRKTDLACCSRTCQQQGPLKVGFGYETATDPVTCQGSSLGSAGAAWRGACGFVGTTVFFFPRIVFVSQKRKGYRQREKETNESSFRSRPTPTSVASSPPAQEVEATPSLEVMSSGWVTLPRFEFADASHRVKSEDIEHPCGDPASRSHGDRAVRCTLGPVTGELWLKEQPKARVGQLSVWPKGSGVCIWTVRGRGIGHPAIRG